MICSIENCGKKVLARGWCNTHYQRQRTYGDPHMLKQIHGENRKAHPLWWTYNMMISRCENPNSTSYPHYGAKGVSVDARWRGTTGFSNFIKDMGERPQNTTLDRLDVAGDYSPDNCRWATEDEQHRNRTDNFLITHNGRTQILEDWATETGIKYNTLWMRLKKYNWPIERALTKEVN